jgi:hypothetical protein
MNQKRISIMIRVVFKALVAAGTFTSLLSARGYSGSLYTKCGTRIPPSPPGLFISMSYSGN